MIDLTVERAERAVKAAQAGGTADRTTSVR